MIQQANPVSDRVLMPQPLSTTTVQVDSDLDRLTDLLTWFEQLDHAIVPDETWVEAQIMLAEGFTNVVRHAHRHLPTTTPVELEVTLFPDCLEIQVWDHGAPFDLDRMLKTRIETYDQTSLCSSGRGLMLLYRVTSFLIYAQMGKNRNRLLMVKQFPSLKGNK